MADFLNNAADRYDREGDKAYERAARLTHQTDPSSQVALFMLCRPRSHLEQLHYQEKVRQFGSYL